MPKQRVFATKNGVVTDIFHSYPYYKLSYTERRDTAFNKEFLDTLSERDKYLMRGYAQAKVEEVQAFKYRNPKYKRKKNARKPSAYSALDKKFNQFN